MEQEASATQILQNVSMHKFKQSAKLCCLVEMCLIEGSGALISNYSGEKKSMFLNERHYIVVFNESICKLVSSSE